MKKLTELYSERSLAREQAMVYEAVMIACIFAPQIIAIPAIVVLGVAAAKKIYESSVITNQMRSMLKNKIS